MKKGLSLLLISMLVMGVVGCAPKTAEAPAPTTETPAPATESASADKSWENVVSKGELVIGNCPEYPPFSSRNASNEIEGFDSDFAKALGEELGVKVTMKDTAWEGLVAGLQKGDHDAIISCMSPEEATSASENVNMTTPYYQLNEIIVTKTSNTDITNKEALKGKVVGVQANCTSEVAVDSLKDMGIVVKEIKRYNRNQEALIDLKNGRVDAVVVGIAYAATQVKGNPDLKVVNDAVRSVDIVAVTNKGADALTTKLNEAIAKVKENGKFDAVTKKWLDL